MTSAAMASVTCIALLAYRSTAAHWPITPQTWQDQGKCSEPAPALGAFVGQTRAGVIHTEGAIAVVAFHILIAGAVVEERLDTAQARGIVDDGLGAAQTRLVAHPGLWQLPWTLALLTATAIATRTRNGIDGAIAQNNTADGRTHAAASDATSTGATAATDVMQVERFLAEDGRG